MWSQRSICALPYGPLQAANLWIVELNSSTRIARCILRCWCDRTIGTYSQICFLGVNHETHEQSRAAASASIPPKYLELSLKPSFHIMALAGHVTVTCFLLDLQKFCSSEHYNHYLNCFKKLDNYQIVNLIDRDGL